ncbi:phage shock protein C (PspC) family protein [Actinacidiphila guanduensis]|uniref:Phage shock protein C (PspC) family protein n=2 Tax=Actinacidiphila guanduensis TaxID=310781 RepID=A0A1H0J8E9_9ACTN|nr:phage shock protein C (PspC) family protein [Actinacidiphila guanduensis]
MVLMTDEHTRARPAGGGTTRAAPCDEREPRADGEAPDRPRLRRGREGGGRVLAGVCHGAGRYFDVDPVIFRIVLVLLSLTGGIGLILYGLGWLVVPQEGEEESEAHRLLSGRIEGAPLTAVLMALVGCGLYASMLGDGANQAFSLLLLFATAAAVYWSQQRGRAQAGGEAAPAGARPAAEAPPEAQAPPGPGTTPSWWREPLTKEPAYLWGPDDGPYEAEDRQAWRQRRREVRREHSSWLFGLVVFVLTVAAAALGTGLSWPHRPSGVSIETGLAAALAVLGCAFVVASVAGRTRGGTVFWSLVVLAGLIAAAALPRAGQGLGTTRWRPQDAAAVRGSYERGAGTGRLDLRALRLDGATVRTRLKVGAGEAEVLLPRDATVRLVYSVGAGRVVLPGTEHRGYRVRNVRHRVLGYGPAAGVASTGTVDLDVSVGAGQLEVVR